MAWPSKSVIYEINTWVWLYSLSQQYGETITLANVPDEVLDQLAAQHLDTIWLMGIWARSPRGRKQATRYEAEYRPALPDITSRDIVGSPYAVWNYEVDPHYGGREALASLRQRLIDRGMHLILDYVPNHVALDHPWVQWQPGYLVQGRKQDLKNRPSDFYAATDAWGRDIIVAHGRDPYFPGWSDTAQVNAFNPAFRQAALQLVLDLASQCDGLRCDMAMLLVNRIFAHTWKGYYNEEHVPQTEFWDEIIPVVKQKYPDFQFIAEVYWNMEFELQRLGFDYTYDKMLYDRLVSGTPREVRVHLIAELAFQKRLIRFIENHDEPRAYASLGPAKSQAAATLASTLPGITLFHDGQFRGRRAKLPVQIGRQPEEPVDEDLMAFYEKLLGELCDPIYSQGRWRMFNLFPAWANNQSFDNLVAHGWVDRNEYRLVVVNLTDVQSQALVNLSPWPNISHSDWRLRDVLNGHDYIRAGDQMLRPGLFIDLAPYNSHIFHFEQQ